MIAEWYGTREQTVYRWFDRLEAEPIEHAVQDRQRPGRPPKLDETARDAFKAAVRRPPAEAGYDRPAWTTALAQQFLEEEFDAEYSRRHVQRLLNDAGLTSHSDCCDSLPLSVRQTAVSDRETAVFAVWCRKQSQQSLSDIAIADWW